MRQPENITYESYPVAPEDFKAHVIEGFSQTPKQLSPRFFYDTRGSELFEQITRLPEYYPTETEKKILSESCAAIQQWIAGKVCIIEPGSGNSEKTEILFNQWPSISHYIPIEISGEHLNQRSLALAQKYTGISIHAVEADYMDPQLSLNGKTPGKVTPVLFFPGSSLGNYTHEYAVEVLQRFKNITPANAKLLIGIDLKKDVATLETAYDDPEGITAKFNKNLIVRMRNQLGLNVHPDDFAHRAEYNAEAGRIEISLISRRRQRIAIRPHVFELEEGEPVYTEYSHKYTVQEFHNLANRAGFTPLQTFIDEDQLFSVHLMQTRS